MRLDMGTSRMTSRNQFRDQFLNGTSWVHVARRARLAAAGTLPSALATELVQCRAPRSKRVDFCFWSAPAAPLVATVSGLDDFDGLAYGHSGCKRYLRLSRFPLHSENLLLCAMRRAGVGMSRLMDERAAGDGENACVGWQECGLGWPTRENVTVGGGLTPKAVRK